MLNRRQFLGSSAAALAMTTLARRAHAQNADGKKFLFVHAEGGWDPLTVFAPLYAAPGINMEAGTTATTIGNFQLVDSAARPSVRTFFESWGSRTLVLNGLSVRSVNHETCQAVSLTGSTSDSKTDWATLLAAGQRQSFDLPHVVFSGPVFTGEHNVLVSRAQGALQPLVRGTLLRDAQPPVTPLRGIHGRAVDRFLAKRAAAVANAFPAEKRAADLLDATQRAQRLMASRYDVELSGGGNVLTRARAAIAALADGVCRCATVGTGFVWDTHIDNTPQSQLFERLFADLHQIQLLLAQTTDKAGRSMANETVVVVMSEMGRTPAYNGTQGRDHWPYTSMMIIGDGVTGNRVVGDYTDGYLGVGVDPLSGELDAARPGISAEELGATLLTLGGIDPGEVLPFADVLHGLLA